MSLFLGLDTSCYTSSAAVVDEKGNLIEDVRRLLKVPQGERGLQQSVGVFQHTQNLPDILEGVLQEIDLSLLAGIAVSAKPRPQPGSYMPVFTVAEGFARVMASALGIPLLRTTHQEGHLMAGIWSAQGPVKDEFLAAHVSGGTTELLKVIRQPGEFDIEILGSSTDLHAGQFIDRVGVEMGLSFPAGPHLEKLAAASTDPGVRIPSSVKGYDVSFSGPESSARRLLAQGIAKADVARAVEHCVAKSLEKVIRQAIETFNLQDVLIVGGVASNTYLRSWLKKTLEHQAVGGRLHFAAAKYATDNAVGVALIGMEQIK